MRNVVTVQGGVSISEIELVPGEALSVVLTWLNSDGTARDLTGHTITFNLVNASGTIIYTGALSNKYLISVNGATTGTWAEGWYTGQLWDNDGSGDVAAGEWNVHVYTPEASAGPYLTVADIVNNVALEVGLQEQADPVAADLPETRQLMRYLVTSARDLVGMRAWSQLRREHSFVTVAGDTGIYDLPSDFHRMVPQTFWDRATPAAGVPAGGEVWQFLAASTIASSIYLIFRQAARELWLWPQPPAAGLEVAFEYCTRNWLMSAGAPRPDLSEPAASTDYVCFDPQLIEAAMRVRYAQATGFDTTMALADFNRAYEQAANADEPASVLRISGPSIDFRFIDTLNAPESGYGIP